MATVSAFIQKKFSTFSFDTDTTEIDVSLSAQGIDPGAELSPSNIGAAKRTMWELIPGMLLLPDVSQGRFSVKRNIEGIKTYYAMLCADLGVENKLDKQPEVRDRSNFW